MTQGDVRDVGGGYQLYFGKGALRVRKGKRSAPLTVGLGSPADYQHVEVTLASQAVTLSYMPHCTDETSTYSRDQLAAALDLEEGQALAAKKKHAAAEKLFAKARALDPGWELALRLDAKALVKLGRLDEAVALLSAKISANPMGEYLRAALDPELAQLLSHPALAKLRPATPGTAKLDATSGLSSSGMARAPGGQLALVSSIGFHGACWSLSGVSIVDGKTLAELGGLPLSGPDDYVGDGCDEQAPMSKEGEARIRSDVAKANKLLAELGFEPLEGERVESAEFPRNGVATLRFPKSKLGLVVGDDGAARLFQDKKMLIEHPPGSAPYLSQMNWAVLVPNEQRIFFSTTTHGCEHAESSHLNAIATP